MNKATKVLMSVLVLTLAFASTTYAQDVTKIRDARALVAEDTTVTIEGIMNTPDYGFSNGQFYVQDSTAGINVFYSGVGGANNSDHPSFTGWTQGDTLRITGGLTTFNGLVEITPDTVIVLGAGTTRPWPVRITKEDLSTESMYQGMIVKLEDVSLADGEVWPADAQTSSGVNVDVVVEDSAFQLRIDRDESYFDGAPAPTERFNLLGLLTRNNDDVQILPFESTDIANIVKVTFTVNTSTAPDTVLGSNYVGVFGGMNSPTGAGNPYLGQVIDWNNSTDIVAENQGGDYWSASFYMAAGDNFNYKYWVGSDKDTPISTGGWESGSDRGFMLPYDQAADTLALLNWYETRTSPFMTEDATDDTVGVFFRVNMGAQFQVASFDPSTDAIQVRGSVKPLTFGDDTGAMLTKEPAELGDNRLYSGIVYFHRDSLAAGTERDGSDQLIPGSFRYKFYADTEAGVIDWESGEDRVAVISPTTADTTLGLKFFNRTKPTTSVVIDTKLNFEVNVGILEGLGFFNAAIDTVFVTGSFNSWNNSQDQMTFNSFSGTYSKTGLDFKTTPDAEVNYKYFIKWDKSRDDSASVNFLSGITHDGSGWEEPGVTGGGNRKFNIVDAADQPTRSEFYNSVEPQALLTSNNVSGGAMTATFSIDMNPAKENSSQPFNPENDSVYLFVDTPFFALTNGITVPGDDGGNFTPTPAEEKAKLQFTDEDDDGIYELEFPLTLPTLNNIGFRIAYGEPTSTDGSLFINGGGTEPGRRFYQFIKPIVSDNGSGGTNVSWPSTFKFPTLTWTASDLPFEEVPDYGTITTSNEGEREVANVFKLDQNYPNPFNPSTNISFSLPNAANVNLTVYNLLGQKVATLINGKTMTSGPHAVAFDAGSLSSGVYIYRLEAGSFVSNKRMTLIK